MNPIYDKNERTVGWLAENVIDNMDGTPHAFIFLRLAGQTLVEKNF